MKREIKFRAKRTDNNEWAYGLLHYSHGLGIWSITTSDGWIPSYNNPDSGESTLFINIEPNTICKYTGLKDKNGKEIYEGDIVINEYETEYGPVEHRNEVSYYEGAFYPICEMPGENFEVIGNVYDNPNY